MENRSKFWRVLVTTMYFKDRKLMPETRFCNSCSMVWKTFSSSEFPNKSTKKSTSLNFRSSVMCLTQELSNFQNVSGTSGKVKMVPTGVAVVNTNGTTINIALGIPTMGQ